MDIRLPIFIIRWGKKKNLGESFRSTCSVRYVFTYHVTLREVAYGSSLSWPSLLKKRIKNPNVNIVILYFDCIKLSLYLFGISSFHGLEKRWCRVNLWQWFRLCFISHLYWFFEFRGIQRRLVFSGQVHREFSMVYKKECSNLTWWSNHDCTCNYFDSTTFVYITRQRIRFSLCISRAYLVICKFAKKWYVLRMRISWMWPWNDQAKWLFSHTKDHLQDYVRVFYGELELAWSRGYDQRASFLY